MACEGLGIRMELSSEQMIWRTEASDSKKPKQQKKGLPVKLNEFAY
jgi:hypothetical protein